MALPVWRKFPDLIQELLNHSHEFDFFQILLILERYLQTNKDNSSDWFNQVKLIPNSSLAFPASDVQQTQLNDQFHFIIYSNFMGFFGVDSPLPQYFLHLSALETDDGERLRFFLQLFNQAIYRLLYLAWQRAHFHLESSQKKYHQYMSALIGHNYGDNSISEITMAGVLSARVLNSLGLKTYIQNNIKNAVVKIKEFQPQWQNNSTIVLLGKTWLKLGDNILLGEKMLIGDQHLVIEIQLNSFSQFKKISATNDLNSKFYAFLENYISLHFKFSLRFFYQVNPLLTLNQGLELGINTTLGIVPHFIKTQNISRLTQSCQQCSILHDPIHAT